MRRNNQKPQRRLPTGLAPWVRVRQAAGALASQGPTLVESARRQTVREPVAPQGLLPARRSLPSAGTLEDAATIYQAWLHRFRIPQRFPDPDWSIADLWVAKELLRQGTPGDAVKAVLREASPQFPRRHADPEDYLQRTLARACAALVCAPFPGDGEEGPDRSGFSAAPRLL